MFDLKIFSGGASSIVFPRGWHVQVDVKIFRSKWYLAVYKPENVTRVYYFIRAGHLGVFRST